MKVKISNYTTWYGPYQIAGILLFWMDKEDDRVHKFGEWLSETFLNDFCEWVHSKKKRKIDVQIDNFDTWNMDHTLAHIILPMLKTIKEQKQDSPYTDDSDTPIWLHSTLLPAEDDYHTDGHFHARWVWILDEMIWTFEQIVCDDEETEMILAGDWNKRDLHEKRISNGLRLFGKYYRSLWT
jgi:hypothetical protein